MARTRPTAAILAFALIGTGVVMSRAPESVHHRLRGFVLDSLKPGISAIAAIKNRSRAAATSPELVESRVREEKLARELAASKLETRRARLESARLRETLSKLEADRPAPFLGEKGEPLFAPEILDARVLDLPSQKDSDKTFVTLAEGTSAQVALAEWVLGDDGITVDQGRDRLVTPDSPVLAGRRVFGRVASTGRFTSRVQHVSDAAFRAYAKLIRVSGERSVRGAEGLLVGTGKGACRLDLIPATEPVEAGDLVITAGTIPGVDQELLLGEVVSAELPPGASHWTISVKPAVQVGETDRLQVVRIGLHRDREPVAPQAEAESATGARK